MGQNYRKKSQPQSTSRFGFLTAVLFAFVTGYITANVFDAESLRQWLSHSVQSFKTETTAAKPASSPQKAELPKPKFEFYTLLSKEHPDKSAHKSLPNSHPMPSHEVREMSRAIQAKVREASPLPPIKTTAHQYDVQLASYNKKTDAERLKAILIMKGFEAKIQQIDQSNGRWFRVVSGPFPSMREAEKAQLSIARSEHVMGIIRRLDA